MDPLLSTALEAAEAAARVHLRYFGRIGLEGAREKAPSDFVSAVDLESQEAALDVIRRRHPSHRILAEEELPEGAAGETARMWPPDGEFLWIVDPLDGTTNYLHGHPQFAASVGVGRRLPGESPELTGTATDRPDGIVEGRVGEGGTGEAGAVERAVGEAGAMVAGAVVAPRTGERWWACRGRGAFKNGLRIRVSSLRSLNTALIGTGFPFKAPELVQRYLDQFRRILPASGGIRRAGSAALDLCYLAEGILDAFWEEAYLSPWDVGAGVVILQEAGGMATRLNGSPLDLENGSVLAANSRELHRALEALIRQE